MVDTMVDTPAAVASLAMRLQRVLRGAIAALAAAYAVLCLPAVLLGTASAWPLLRTVYPGLAASWGETLALAWGRALLVLLAPPAAAPAGAAGVALPGMHHWLRLLGPQLWSALDRSRAWPWRLGGHLCALALWLGLMAPLAWGLRRWQRRLGERGRPAAAGAVAVTLLPTLCVAASVAWLGLPAGSECWAPALAGCWLAAWCRAATGGPA